MIVAAGCIPLFQSTFSYHCIANKLEVIGMLVQPRTLDIAHFCSFAYFARHCMTSRKVSIVSYRH